MRRSTLFLFAFSAFGQAPDTIYFNGKIVTMWAGKPAVQAVALTGDRFQAVGTDAEVLKTAGPRTRKIDLASKTVLPGLMDSHVHPITAAFSEIDGPIPPFRSIADIQEYILAQSKQTPPSKLIFVPKVYSTRLREHRYPTKQELDQVAPAREAIVDNGYSSVLNSALMKRMGLTKDSPQPANGTLVKDAKGELTGLVLGAPQLMASVRRTRETTPQDYLWALEKMQAAYNQAGITSIIDRSEGPEGFRAYQTMRQAGKLTVRATVTYLISAAGTPADVRRQIESIPFITGAGDSWFRVGPIKTVIDGGILTGTAYLRESYGPHTEIYGYADPNSRGILTVPRENVFEMARVADELGWQMTAHTTGGGSTDMLLDAYEAADAIKPINGRRFTVTHGNFPDARAIARAKKLGVIFDVQPAWLYLDGPAIQNVFGDRMKDFQPLRSILDAGVVAAGGSDHMIRFDSRLSTNPYNPFLGMWIAITRKMVDGKVLNPEQRISRMEALKMWTWNGAYTAFSEAEKGSIEPGKYADMVIIDRDFATGPEDEIQKIEPLQTIVGGKVVYAKQ